MVFALLGVAPIFMGGTLPAVVRSLRLAAGQIGTGGGRMYAANTFGAILGTLASSFLLIPWLGIRGTSFSAALICVAAASLAFWFDRRPSPSEPNEASARPNSLVRGAVLAVIFYAVAGAIALGYEVLWSQVVVSLMSTRAFAFSVMLATYLTGLARGASPFARRADRVRNPWGLLPLIIHNDKPKSALVIGLGTGITAGALLQYPELEHRVVAELLPEVLKASSVFEGNFGAVSDPRLDLRLRDGRRELMASDQNYDLITLEPPPPSASGVVNLYSTGFYELAVSRLNHGGLVAQWLPLPTQNEDDTRSLVRSFLEVFPHASLWTTEVHEMLLVGSLQPIDLDVARISQRFNEPALKAALSEVGVATP